jgi:hypothetical protein
MNPPLRVTGDPIFDWLVCIVVAGFCLYWLRAFRLAREGVLSLIGSFAIGVLIFIVGAQVLVAAGVKRDDAPLIAGLVGGAYFLKSRNRRSRYIPASVKRAVIARDLKGKRYNSAKHHIDHVWPYSRGGSNTIDNLRVIEKEKNLQKGARRPALRDMW